MSSIVEISPVPQGVSRDQLKQLFKSYVIQKAVVKGDKGYLKFVNSEDIQLLDMDDNINSLGVTIVRAPQNFDWSLVDQEQKVKQKELSTEDFLLPQKEQEISQKYLLRSQFIKITDCQCNHVSQEQIKRKIFNKFKIGRILKYKNEVYIQFMDENQIQLLDTQFPGLVVKQLGYKSSLSLVDENFNFDLVKKQVELYEKNRAEVQKENKRKQIERRKLEQIQKLRKQRESSSSWSVKPDGPRPNNVQISQRNTNIFWTVVIAIWGFYVIFL